MSWKKVRIKEVLKQYRVQHIVQDDIEYKQVSILNNGSVVVRGNKIGKEIGRKRQFKIDLNTHPDTLIFTRQLLLQGSVGIASEDVHGCIVTENMPMFSIQTSKIDKEFLILFLKSEVFKSRIRQIELSGSAQKSIHERTFLDLEFTLPDIDLQKIIVVELLKLKSNGEDISSELNHQLDLIKQLRQAFLREAMQGKLLAPSPSERAGGVDGQHLLTKIKAEKAKLIAEKKLKKEKELPPIANNEIPFEIPKHWAWCRLGEVIYDTDSGKSPNCVNQPVNEVQWGVIKTTAVQEMFFLENENKILPKRYIVNEQHKICEGDILITRAGPKNRVGVVCCVEKLTKNLILSDKTIRIKFSKELLSPKYFTIALNSPLIKKIIEKKMTGMADSQVNITQDNIKGFTIPLPPLHEQEQIVAKLAELMAFCDGLEQSIKESQGYNEMLLQQVLREALQGEEV